jgi:hypothetical protein
MSLQIKKETGVVYDPVFLKILEDIPGGVTIATSRFPDTIKTIKKGALLNASASSVGLYNIIKTAKVTAKGVSGVTVLAVEPTDHLFKIGDRIYLYGATASTITRVSSTAIAFTTGLTSPGSVATATVLYEPSAINTSTALHDADAILRDTIEVRRGGIATLLGNIFAGAVVRGTVDESELPYFVTSTHKTDLTARIRFA